MGSRGFRCDVVSCCSLILAHFWTVHPSLQGPSLCENCWDLRGLDVVPATMCLIDEQRAVVGKSVPLEDVVIFNGEGAQSVDEVSANISKNAAKT